MPDEIKKIDIEKEAIAIVRNEWKQWDDARVFITRRVAFNMRLLIDTLRNNYWGIFREPKDPLTGRDKIFVPLTESIVDAVVKNVDLDTKDVNLRAKKPSAARFTKVARAVLRNWLEQSSFGEDLDELESDLAIDGTKVWKTVECIDPISKKMTLMRMPLDLLNCYIDPTARSIQEAYRFTERALLTQDQVQSYKYWINTEGIEGTEGLNRREAGRTNNIATKTNKYVDVWEMWGKIPKALMTGLESDRGEEVDGHIIVSGLESTGKERVHLIETYKGYKPYEEAWYKRVSGRWYGRGVAEKVMWLQVWINTIVNIRINRSYVAQLGIFKIKKGAGVTPQMVSRLASNGAITVTSMDDIEQFVMQEASQASYQDEKVINDWAQRVTSAFEAATGEQLPSSTPATNAAISSRASQSAFTMIKEGVGMFLQRWIKRHVLTMLMKRVKPGDVEKYTGDPEDMVAYDEQLVNFMVAQEIDNATSQGLFVDPAQIEQERQRAMQALQSMGNERFVQLAESIPWDEFDSEIFITNEEADVSVMTQNLITALQAAPEYRDQIMEQVFDLMGIGPLKKPQVNPMMQPQPGQAPPNTPGNMPPVQTPAPNPQVAMTRAVAMTR